MVLKVRCPVSRLPTSVGIFRSQLETLTAAVKDSHTWGIVLHPYAQARINFEAPHPRGDCSEESLLVALPVVTTPPHVGALVSLGHRNPCCLRTPHSGGDCSEKCVDCGRLFQKRSTGEGIVPHFAGATSVSLKDLPTRLGIARKPQSRYLRSSENPTQVGIARNAAAEKRAALRTPTRGGTARPVRARNPRTMEHLTRVGIARSR